jgi:23S rRNA (cytosine1962-C5)-methyltransferase
LTATADPFTTAGIVRLKPGRDFALRRRHPWVYRGAIATPPPPAGPVEVRAADGALLGTALAAAGEGSLALRMVAWPGETWGAELLRRRLADAAALRERLAIDSDAFRVVHAEGDLLPGLVIDRYGTIAVIEVFDSAWLRYLDELSTWLRACEEITGSQRDSPSGEALGGVKSANSLRGRGEGEGPPLKNRSELVIPSQALRSSAGRDGEPGCGVVLLRRGEGRRGEVTALHGELPGAPIEIREGALRLPVDLVDGHKTGFYLDQRDNRRRLGELSQGAEVLNLFSYSGGFSLAALARGAVRAINVDASDGALALARGAYRMNSREVSEADFVLGDAFEVARAMVAAASRFDVVVVDPPSFVRRRTELAGGLRGLKDINLQALKLLRPGGLLLTCSCSALLDHEAFAGALAAAAVDAGRTVRVLEVRGAAPDHPIALACRETRHLQAWFCHVA